MPDEDQVLLNSPEPGNNMASSSASSNSGDNMATEENIQEENTEMTSLEDSNYRNSVLNRAASFQTAFSSPKSTVQDHDPGVNGDADFSDTQDNNEPNSSGLVDEEHVEQAVNEGLNGKLAEADESAPNDSDKTANDGEKDYTVDTLLIDMAKLKEGKSKSGSHRTESIRSRHSQKSQESSERSKKKSSRKTHQFGTSENPLDITEMTVDCGSLLELYQNDYFDAFMHMYHLYHKKEPGVHEYLVNMLYTKRTDEEILFYLPQLCQLSISKYGKSSLHRFLLDKASVSMHFALQLSWFYQAAIDDQIPKYDRLTQKMTQDTEMAVVNCKLISPNSFSRPSAEMPISENLSFPCLLDRRLLLGSFSKRVHPADGNFQDLSTSVESLLTPQMPTSLVHNTFTLSTPSSKVKLVGVHTKLGNPLDLETHPILDYTDDLHLELQKLMMKQRRLNYFNTLNNFVALCMQNSSLLTTEAKRDSRDPLLKVFASALNEWMLLRRSTVAAYEESFAYTGLSLPFDFLNRPDRSSHSRNDHYDGERSDHAFSQIIRIVEGETKIFFSKKRAPFVFYVEMANLDEDIEMISHERGLREFNMGDLYVFDAIVDDLVKYDLLTPMQVATIKNPLECIRFALDMLPTESLERYKTGLEKLKSESSDNDQKSQTPDESLSVSRVSSCSGSVMNGQDTENAEYYTKLNESMEGLGVNGDSARGSECSDTPKDGDPSRMSDSGDPANVNGDAKQSDKDSTPRDAADSAKESARDKEGKFPNVKNLTSQEVKSIIFTETFEQKKDRIRRDSPYGHLKSWDLCAFVVKGADDLRQEKMANQVLESFRRIFTKAKLPLWLRPIEILVTGSNSGIMEFLHDTYSVDVIKRKFNAESLAPVFEKLFCANIYEARKNFIESHAAYSIVSYLLQVKDRHNGNILLDPYGHVIHIDYGFCLSNFPGKLISFETSPFKLTKEYLDVIGGGSSDNFTYFKKLVINGLLEARKYVDEIVLLVEMMTTANKMPCFLAGTAYTIEMFKERFMLNQSEETCVRKITEMIDASVNSFTTTQYDAYQRLTNGIM